MILEGVFGTLIGLLAAVVLFLLVWKIFKNLLGAILPAIALLIALWLFSSISGTLLSIIAVIIIFLLIWKVFKRLVTAMVLAVALFILLYFIGWI